MLEEQNSALMIPEYTSTSNNNIIIHTSLFNSQQISSILKTSTPIIQKMICAHIINKQHGNLYVVPASMALFSPCNNNEAFINSWLYRFVIDKYAPSAAMLI